MAAYLTQKKSLSLKITTVIFAAYLIFSPLTSQAATMHFFSTNLLPPPNGMYLCTDDYFAFYAPGIVIKNWSNRLFSSSIVPPPPGYPVTHSFSTKAEFEISFDGGSTWQSVEVNNVSETMYIEYQNTVDGNDIYNAEVTSLTVSGGGLPMCVQIRESPFQVSSGQTRIKPIPGGYQISSFFDIYTEVSTDCGMSWYPTFIDPGYVELKVDPELVTAVAAPSTVLPMPGGQYVSPEAWHQAYQDGIIIKDIRHKLFTDWNQPPPLGQTDTHTFDSQADFKVSIDGGMSFMPVRAPATMTVKISNIREFQGRATYETEATQLDISGGDLPYGVLIRESPTRASGGGTSMVTGGGGGGAGGGAAISSFFDIFTEVSTDGGSVWYSDTNGPAHVELQAISEEEIFTDPNVPPIGSEYYYPDPCFVLFANGVQLDNFMLRDFSHSFPLPPEGYTDFHSLDATAKMLVSLNGGLTFTPIKAPAAVSMSITGRGHSGDVNVTHYYDTEMTQLDISGGSLPAGVMIRESPTKASSGRISQRAAGGGAGGGAAVSSFFDVWLEISTDGGYSWMPSSSGPGTVIIRYNSCNRCSNFDGIGRTNMADFAKLAKNWRWIESPGNAVNIADLDCDGDVEMFDLDIFVDNWLLACP
jgi:hypothetical protein